MKNPHAVDAADAGHPFRLVTAPAHDFLNTSFTETRTSRKKLGRPTALLHPDDCAAAGIEAGDPVRLGNSRGSVVVHAQPFAGLQRGTVVVESIWPNAAFVEGLGINALISAEPAPPALRVEIDSLTARVDSLNYDVAIAYPQVAGSDAPAVARVNRSIRDSLAAFAASIIRRAHVRLAMKAASGSSQSQSRARPRPQRTAAAAAATSAWPMVRTRS